MRGGGGAEEGEPAGERPAAPLWPLYAGGFLGPFAGAMTAVMLPELARGLGTSVNSAALAVSWYMVPFAACMLFSGTLATRWGEARVVRWAFAAYVAASLVCVSASSLTPFLLGRAAQGAANAFTTPLLISMLMALCPPARRGHSMGVYASMQAAGVAFAPVVGGLAAAVDYRWAFALTALAAGLLAVVMPQVRPVTAQGTMTSRARWAALANRALARACAIGFTLQVAATGITLLIALLALDRFGLDPAARGLVATGFGVAGLLTGSFSGRLADRIGLRTVGVASMALLGGGVALAGVAPWLWLLVAATAAAGAGNTGARVLTQSLAVRSTPANSSGATSVMLSVQFLGGAVAPAAIPFYQHAPAATCAAVGAVALAGAVLALRTGPGGV